MSEGDRISRAEKAVVGLRGLILSGEFSAGSRLPEVAVAERLGISRTPLRQAMDLLVQQGLLERIDTGGCRVASFTREDIFDAIELRGVLEGTAARLAAERGATEAQLEAGRHFLDQIDAVLAD